MRKILFVLVLLFMACKEDKTTSKTAVHSSADTLQIDYAKGFSIIDYSDYKILKVKNPVPNSTRTYTYALVSRDRKLPDSVEFDERIFTPIQNIVVTSTTHIPALEELNEEQTLIGFPHLDYISSPKTRKRIEDKKIADIGENENINIEILLSLQPEALVGFSVTEDNKVYSNISRTGIPILYNGDWNELHPLGKAEWIKFFGALYEKDSLANAIFKKIENSYNEAKKLADQVKERPTVIGGSMYKDVWYMPAGESWMAQFIKDAGGNYVYRDTQGTGSLSLSIESVLEKASDADIWVAPDGYTTYQQLEKDSDHYTRFKAFQNQEIYTYSLTTGPTGGITYFEVAPNRPDWVLKDLIHIFHPDLLKDYQPHFYKPLK